MVLNQVLHGQLKTDTIKVNPDNLIGIQNEAAVLQLTVTGSGRD